MDDKSPPPFFLSLNKCNLRSFVPYKYTGKRRVVNLLKLAKVPLSINFGAQININPFSLHSLTDKQKKYRIDAHT